VSYAIDLNVLVLASNSEAVEHTAARTFLEQCAARPEVLCLAWPTVMGYLRITTHPSIFSRPLSSHEALANPKSLIAATFAGTRRGGRFLRDLRNGCRQLGSRQSCS
jgi:predicted nucleic acid-binding protein